MEGVIGKLIILGVAFIVLVVWMVICKPDWLGDDDDNV